MPKQFMPNDQAYTILALGRLFALLAIGAPTLWFRPPEGLLALLGIAMVWTYQTVAAIRRDLDLTLPPPVEAVAVGIVCAVGMESSPTILAALVVPPLFATLSQGLKAIPLTVALEVIATCVVGVTWQGALTSEEVVSVLTWAMAGVGLGLASGFTFAADRAAADELRPYHEAQELIRQLIDLSGNLRSGLDPAALSGELLGVLGDHLPTRAATLYVPRGDGLTPVGSRPEPTGSDAAVCETRALEAWSRGDAVVEERAFAFAVSDHAVVAGLLDPDGEVDLDPAVIEDLREQVAAPAVRLDTALLFTQFRDAATSDERQRLAREMHDGVAQDIASLGYIVDALAAGAANEQQAQAFATLRDRVTKVVAEVRQSVMNLRTSIGESESLGAAIGGVARHLSEASGIAIQVRLEEQPTRLRPEVEAELFRIAQEAINNAVKHSRAQTIDVLCRVAPPAATITVTDDGVGLQSARTDSHGLKIMRERARLIGAELDVRDNASRGMTVAVRLRPLHEDPPEQRQETTPR
ncbi:sensor histidine kinase [Nocardioides sambongensis]|uniref:sensor histidine kinase n=1 Tax=Nocardioides sambongensis TaxID=2589074 RepID=UPI00112EC458|nr:sensor histidine kinase [Nocardioides sambongensis]